MRQYSNIHSFLQYLTRPRSLIQLRTENHSLLYIFNNVLQHPNQTKTKINQKTILKKRFNFNLNLMHHVALYHVIFFLQSYRIVKFFYHKVYLQLTITVAEIIVIKETIIYSESIRTYKILIISDSFSVLTPLQSARPTNYSLRPIQKIPSPVYVGFFTYWNHR